MNKRKLTLIIEREIAEGRIRIGNSCMLQRNFFCRFYLLRNLNNTKKNLHNTKKNYNSIFSMDLHRDGTKMKWFHEKNSFDYYFGWFVVANAVVWYIIYLYLRNLSPSEWKRIIVIIIIIIIIIVWLSFFAITLLLFALRSLLFIIVPVQFHWAA